MDVQQAILSEIESLDKKTAEWILSMIQYIKADKAREKLLEVASKGIFRIPLRYTKKSVVPIKGKGKLLSEIVIEQRG